MLPSAFWLIALIVLLVGEAITIGLTFVWFAVGALGALIVAVLGGALWLQVVIFLALSGVTLALARPVFARFLKTSHAATNADAQFIESKEISIRDIARYFGIPLYKLQEGKQAYGSNEQNAIEYVVGTLHPIVNQYEEEQTWKILAKSQVDRGLELRINLMAELKGDTSARADWYQTLIDAGVFSVNDILALEDMPDVPGGEHRRASLNYVPLADWAELSRIRAASRPLTE